MRRLSSCLWFLACMALAPETLAQEDPAEQREIHRELTALREEATAALNEQNIDRLLEFVHPQVVFTAPYPTVGEEVRRGRDGVKAYFDEMFNGPDRRAESMTTEITVDDRSLIYGDDTAIAWGSSLDTYHMLDGADFVVPTRWSGALVKEDGKWLIAEFHVSVNMFNNPLLVPAIKRTAWISGGVAAAMGVLLGAGVMLLVCSRRAGLSRRSDS